MSLSTSGKRIIVIGAATAIVIGGAAAAIPITRHFKSAKADNEITTEAVTEEYVTELYTVQEFVTDENKETVTDPSGNALTTIKTVARTIKNTANKGNNSGAKAATTKKATGTTKPAATTTKPAATKEGGEWYSAQDALSKKALAGYRYNPEGDFYYTDDKDCWQVNTGYNQVYDKLAPAAAMFIDQVRIRFPYEGKDWMIQLWKGQYGFLFVGAEIGVYTAPEGTYTGASGDINHYNCAAKSDWLKMSLDCYWAKNNNGSYKKIFSRPYDYYWWATGFVPGQLTKYTAPRTELKVKGRITFKSTTMANLFVSGMKESGFKRSADQNNLVDDSYFQSGADVWFLWSTKNHEAFNNGTRKETTTKAPATTKAQPTTTAAPAPTTTEAPKTEAPTTEAPVTTTEAPAAD
ncbi:MAG: DUF4474 domain-containing protein [Clostridia bacterium]|nr:DUF4474 domain-containing protein [Clostridia bacterium]